MAKLTKKQLRTIDYALDRLFSVKSFLVPLSVKDFIGNNYFTRSLRLSGNRTILLTDSGLSNFRTIVRTINDADTFDGLADYSDVWIAFHNVLEDLLSKSARPDNAVNLLELLDEQLASEIASYTYAVPLFGVEMDGIDSIELGCSRIARSPKPYLERVGVEHVHTDLQRTIEDAKNYLWLIGPAKGTRRVSLEKFREFSQLVTGMLAVCASSMYERGAHRVRIGVIMSPEEGHGKANWLSWDDKKLSLATHHKWIGSQNFKINGELLEQFSASGTFDSAFKIFESSNRSQLEETIIKGVYWFSDAHRDTTLVMQFIKYWSCIETFFTSENNDITRSVSVGLVSVLVHGGYGFVPGSEYSSLKKRIATLYNIRSRALHGGKYNHVSERNVDDLSQWAAWMLITMVSFVARGYTKINQIKKIVDRLDKESETLSKERVEPSNCKSYENI